MLLKGEMRMKNWILRFVASALIGGMLIFPSLAATPFPDVDKNATYAEAVGVFGMFVGIWLYCRNMKVSGWVVLDNMGICSGITATFIRLGNLMNSEIIGKVTDVPWAFIFVREDQYPRHPGQLYEALAYFCFFLFILFIYKKRGPKSVGTGFYFGLCLTLIFTFRFFIEYTKEIQVAFEAGLPMDMGQILSIPLIIAGVWSIASSTKRAKEKNVETK